ncbi:hypothetical protein HFO63_00440 [Rhizobium laguerreae]|nr:hypothetical protein [Rhizobium laguerreae]
MVLGGIGSFWLVTGGKDEPKLVLEDLDEPRQATWPMVSSLTSPIRGNAIFDLPSTVEAFDSPGRRKVISFATVTRILAAYSPRDIRYDEVVVRLRECRLAVPSGEVMAIEVRSGEWLNTQFIRLSSGLYGLSPGADARSIFVTTMENRPETIRLPSGLLIFLSQPRWSFAEEKDLRPEHEVLASAERWLVRSKLALDGSPGDGGDIAEGLRHLVASSVDSEEKADLSAAIRLLAGRQSLLEVMPQMLSKDPAFQERLKQFELEEKDRLKAALQSRLETEIQSEQSRLAEIRSEIAEAETRLALAGQREVLLRGETEKHDETIRARIAEVAKQIHGEANARADGLREEISHLREMVSQMMIPAVAVADAPTKTEPEPVAVPEKLAPAAPVSVTHAGEDARKAIVSGLSTATGLSPAQITAILLRSTEDIPVLIGEQASGTAADIVAAIGGDDSALAFCDPSRISWQDLLRDETSDLAVAVAKARFHPDVLVPIAICGISNGPCEYWIPQFIESRRIGRLPRNLAIIASAGVDGMRVSVPDSILRFLVPVQVPDKAKPVRKLYAGPWPAELEFNRGRMGEAIDVLSQAGTLDGAALQRTAKILSRAPPGTAMADVGKVFLCHADWLKSISSDGQYDFKKQFKNIEG